MTCAETIITCHHNADFDAVASLIGASLLYPGAALVFPGTQEKNLQALYDDALQYLYAFIPARTLDPGVVRRLVVVDTGQADRVPHVRALLDKPDVEIHVWDHHPAGEGMIHADFVRTDVCGVGATSTLLAEELERRGLRVRCEDASLLGMGIYGDTGSFTFPSTTDRDYRAAAWLRARGMDLGLIASLLRQDLSRGHVRALNDMLESAEIHELGTHILAMASVQLDAYLNDFATLAPRFMELQPCHVFFGLGAMGDAIQVVARSRVEDMDVGIICSQLGGGGHHYAAAASVRNRSMPELRDFILSQVSIQANPAKTAGQLMSSPVVGVEEGVSLREAEAVMGRYGLKAVPVFRPGTRLCSGWLEYQLAVRAINHGLGGQLASDYMQRHFQVVDTGADLQTLMDVIVGSRQRLAPVVSGSAVPEQPGADGEDARQRALREQPVVGVVTRTDLIRLFMDEEAVQLPQPRQRSQRKRNLARVMKARVPVPCVKLLEMAGCLGSRLGLNVYAVGGFVRDLIMDRKDRRWPDMDIDLVVEGDAIAFARALAGELSGRVRDHREFLTALVLFPESALRCADPADEPDGGAEPGHEIRVDVATARLEYYTSPAALPTVELSSIKMDLYRRDFTINAMAVRLNEGSFGELVDFFDGQNDIRQKRIRMLHALSFVDDPTRALRAVRFEQRYGFRIGPQCERLIRNALGLGLMDKLSGGRILNELELMLKERNPLACFTRMQEFDMLAAIHPQLDLAPWKAELLEKILDVLAWYRRLYQPEQPDLVLLFLLALCRNTPTPDLRDVSARLDLSASRRGALLAVRAAIMDALPRVHAWQADNGLPSHLHEILTPLPLEGLLYLIARADSEELRKKLTLHVYQGRLEKPEVNGADLRALGLAPGPVYGRILKRVLAAKLDGEAPGREEQLALARTLALQDMRERAGHKS
ncbi:MAG: CBS domain-containing protein [Desulfovibrionaceae bacterium]|nr:CBS domain-containing protein [Desulfovibrionaceae bacterium]